MLGFLCSLSFVACDDDDDPVVHTDASVLVNGTFSEEENTQAVTVKIVSPTLTMDQEAVFNVAKAGNDRYTFGNGSAAAARNTGGVIEGNNITIYTTLSSKYKFNATASAKAYTIKGSKSAE